VTAQIGAAVVTGNLAEFRRIASQLSELVVVSRAAGLGAAE